MSSAENGLSDDEHDMSDMFGSSDEEQTSSNNICKGDRQAFFPGANPQSTSNDGAEEHINEANERNDGYSNEEDMFGCSGSENAENRVIDKSQTPTTSTLPIQIISGKDKESPTILSESAKRGIPRVPRRRLQSQSSKKRPFLCISGPPLSTQKDPPVQQNEPQNEQERFKIARAILQRHSRTEKTSPLKTYSVEKQLTKRTWYPNIDASHYWKTLRNWDFLSDLNDTMRSDNKGKASTTGKTQQPLPDVFESPEQYKALWSPLLLEETKSQYLTSITPELPKLKRAGSGGLIVPVVIKALDAESNASHSETVTLSVSMHRGGGRRPVDNPLHMDELVLLIPDPAVLIRAAQGELAVDSSASLSGPLMKNKRLGILGHTLSWARDGSFKLSVSRKLWASISSLSEAYLFRLGTNVTSHREYNALMKIDKIPLTKYLLKAVPAAIDENDDNKNVLSGTGGESALPIGFRIFCKSKFNKSQIEAITAAAREYGRGGFTLVKGPPGTGKTTTLVSLLNSLHLRQYQRYYEEIERIARTKRHMQSYEEVSLLETAALMKPRILVCAPSNTAVDNIIQKIIESGFVDGNGGSYKPAIVRVGVGQSSSVARVSLKNKIEAIVAHGSDLAKLEETIGVSRKELRRLQGEIWKLLRRMRALISASPHALSEEWEVRINEEDFDRRGGVVFVNHKKKSVTQSCPPPAAPHEAVRDIKQMPHYKSIMDTLVKYVERHNVSSSKLHQFVQVQNTAAALAENGGAGYHQATTALNQDLETHLLDAAHIVLTTLGSAGTRTVESASKFEVIVVDEAAQSAEPSSLVALQLGSSHAVLVGDPQQLPATIFSLSGRSTKYDRSLFQRLEEAGHPVHMLDTQYRMNPRISEFPRRIFYNGKLLDGINVKSPLYGGKLSATLFKELPHIQPLTIFDIESVEERDGTSLSNAEEAKFALHLYQTLDRLSNGMSKESRVALITPYSQQVTLLRQMFVKKYGPAVPVDVSTVDSFQGKEAPIVIFSCVRATGKGGGIGFLSDVQRMNVALTRAKHFLFIIAHLRTILVNPYWRDLVTDARARKAVIRVPFQKVGKRKKEKQDSESRIFPALCKLHPLPEERSDEGRAKQQAPGDPRTEASAESKATSNQAPVDPRTKASTNASFNLQAPVDPRKVASSDATMASTNASINFQAPVDLMKTAPSDVNMRTQLSSDPRINGQPTLNTQFPADPRLMQQRNLNVHRPVDPRRAPKTLDHNPQVPADPRKKTPGDPRRR